MTLKFSRIQAGEYQINEGSKIVGYIQKKSNSKWTLYKCSNPSMLGNPIAVQKTLKELKVDAETLITSSQSNASVKPVKETKTSSMDEDKFDIMREMLNQNYVIDLNEYKQTKDGLEEVPNSFNHFLSEEEIAAL